MMLAQVRACAESERAPAGDKEGDRDQHEEVATDASSLIGSSPQQRKRRRRCGEANDASAGTRVNIRVQWKNESS